MGLEYGALGARFDVGSVDGFITVRGGHTEIENDPAHAAVAAGLLNTLEENKKRRVHGDDTVELRAAA